jgi:hypothetical protein
MNPAVIQKFHALLKKGVDVTGVTIVVRVSWRQAEGVRSQNFVYNDEQVLGFIESYGAAAAGKYGQQFWLTLTGVENIEDLTFTAVVKSDTGVEFTSTNQ